MNSFGFNTNPWSDEDDGVFFALTATLFAPSYTYGASVLLASYDLDDEPAATSEPTRPADARPPTTVTTQIVVSWKRWAQS
jgi:hypothetical protein